MKTIATSQIWKRVCIFIGITAAYVLSAEIGLSLATINDNASPFWPATGFAIASLYFFGRQYWLSVFTGALIANTLAGSPVLANLGIAGGNASEAILGALALHFLFSKTKEMQFEGRAVAIVGASIIAPIVSAAIGGLSLVAAGVTPIHSLSNVIWTWWIGDVLGALVFIPLLIELFSYLKKKPPIFLKPYESLLIFGSGFAASYYLFRSDYNSSYLFFVFPFLLLSILRLSRIETHLFALMICAISIYQAVQGGGPFQGGSLNERLIFLQLFLGALSVTVLVLQGFQDSGGIRAPAIIALLVGWTLSGTLFYSFHTKENVKDLARFEALKSEVTDAIRTKVEIYDDALRGGLSLFAASKSVDRYEWKAYADTLRVVERHPGINGIGVIKAIPKSQTEEFITNVRKRVPDFEIKTVPSVTPPPSDQRYIITFIEPLNTNLPALGLDIATETNRFNAANLARDTGKSTITQRITLVQDNKKSPGFLYYIPLYKKNMPLETVVQRRAAHIGWVYAPFITHDFVTAAIGRLEKELDIVIFDGKDLDASYQIFAGSDFDHSKDFETHENIEIGQQIWSIGFRRSDNFVSSRDTTSAWASFAGALMTLFLVGFIVSFQSIGIRAKALADQRSLELRSSETRYRSLVESAPMGIILTTADAKIIEMNDTILKILGYTREDFENGLVTRDSFSPKETRHLDVVALERCKRGENAVAYEKEYIRKDGSRIPVLVGISLIADSHNHLTIFVVDLTDRKALENQLIEARNIALKAGEARSQFMATMSHEIRTPLNGIIGMTDLLLDMHPEGNQLKYTKIAHESAKNLLTIVNDILDFSKIEAGKLRFEKVEFNPKQLVEDQTEIFIPRLEAKGVKLTTYIDPQIPDLIVGDSGRLAQILINLLGNATKFTDQGNIHVSVKLRDVYEDKIYLYFSVRDTGIGMKLNQIDALFEPFQQGDASTSRKYGGTGLGLSISKRLVEMMNGKIGVRSDLDEGSEFYFTAEFQQAQKTDQNARARDIEYINFDQTQATSNPKTRILVAEDNSANQVLALAYLKALGYSAQAVGNGMEALEAVSTGVFDLVLMDCQMPEMDGYEATKKIRSLANEVKNTRIIALTANAMSEDRERCLAAGMDDFLSKPFTKKQLQDILEKWIGTQKADIEKA